MHFEKVEVNTRAARLQRGLEKAVNLGVRGYDRSMTRLHLGGRKAAYDDTQYEFVGGAQETLRKKHYDKSMRLLWKAEQHTPWSSFKDMTDDERTLREMADQAFTPEEKTAHERISSSAFREMLDREYTLAEKQAIVEILSAIGHGEAYAWLVSAEVLTQVKSTGAKAALTMQVLEEAKHFVVLRELIQAFDVEVPRLSAWEYVLLERVYKADGLEKLFGMNVLVEGIALSIFGMMSSFPGLEVLRLFHLDESRHTALPVNYFKEFPMGFWERKNPARQFRRLNMLLPAIPLVFHMEKPLAELGIDSFQFGGSVIRKVALLAERSGFEIAASPEAIGKQLSLLFNAYAFATRPGHEFQHYDKAETTSGAAERAVEDAIFKAA